MPSKIIPDCSLEEKTGKIIYPQGKQKIEVDLKEQRSEFEIVVNIVRAWWELQEITKDRIDICIN